MQAKAKLCAIPCKGEYLFGPTLDELLEKAGDDKKKFPNLFNPYRRPFNKRRFNRGGKRAFSPGRDRPRWEDRRKRALHIKGKENVAADFLSRNVLKQGEWSLNEDIFNLVVRRWGQPVVDLFATRNNRKGESPGGRRVSHEMGFSTSLCFPTTEPDTSSGEENQGGSSESHPYRPLLAQKNLVCLAQDNVCSGPLGTARDPELAFAGTDLPSTSDGAPFDGMVFERSLLVGKGFSPNLVETLLKSRKQVTTKIYSRTWRKFLSCSKFNIQDGVPVQQILEFLQKGFELKLSPSTLRKLLSDERLCHSEVLYAFLSPSPEHLKVLDVQGKKSSFSLSSFLERLPGDFFSHQEDETEEDSDLSDYGDDVDGKKDALAEPCFMLIVEIFELRGMFKWVRKTLIALVQITFGRTINKQIRDTVNWIFSEQMLVYYINVFRDAFWPNGKLASPKTSRTELQYALQNLVGQQNARHGIIKIFNALQENRANKHLLYVLLEVLLVELCPELRTHLEQLKAGPACDGTKGPTEDYYFSRVFILCDMYRRRRLVL
ncbi:unnamed protein product [Ranitomeya imitator]|uniref:Sorting nexin C-terminal domain-containing protein n=1 Tax=Ranitomeya imitator TaxID=111125 RepID=A0ABN9M199_9NEOB|nr:unnamed protein product [Ranitomeya imitator]